MATRPHHEKSAEHRTETASERQSKEKGAARDVEHREGALGVLRHQRLYERRGDQAVEITRVRDQILERANEGESATRDKREGGRQGLLLLANGHLSELRK